jgi:RNA polymerase sigma-70 factor (ECF subfamily)
MDDFGAFYELHVTAVTAYVARRAQRPDVTFDLVAETFARALEHRDRYDPRKGPAIAWLFGIARNLIVDAARRGRVADAARVRLGMEPIALDDEQLERIVERGNTDLREALAALPESQREAVLRRVLGEQSYPEIAAHVGCSEQVVRQRVSRGLAALRRGLEAR